MDDLQESRKFPPFLGIVFLCLVAAIAVGGYLFYRSERNDFAERHHRMLLAVADIKADNVGGWLQERIKDAETACRNPWLVRAVSDLFGPKGGRNDQDVRSWLNLVREHNGYADVLLLDASGQVRLSARETVTTLEPETQQLVERSLRERKILVSDLYYDSRHRAVLSVAAPIEAEGVEALGAILLRIDPRRFLFPQIQDWPMQSWPISSDTAEVLLVRRDGDSVLFLNELRQRRNTALSLRIPLASQKLLAVKAALGGEGMLDGLDYRGVRVLGAARHVAGSTWFVVAKVDAEEIYQPIRQQAWLAGVVCGLLICGAAAMVGWLWRQREGRAYRRLYEVELERRALASHFEYLHRYASDSMLLVDEHGRILEANERALGSYGWSKSEMLERNIRDLMDSEALAAFEEQWKSGKQGDGSITLAVHRRKDGSTFPVEVSSRLIEIDGRRFWQSIIRDITERAGAEQALRQSEERLARAQSMAALGDWEIESPDIGTQTEHGAYHWSDEVYRIFGVSKESFTPTRGSFLELVAPEDRERLLAAVERAAKEGTSYDIEHWIVRPDGNRRYVREHAELLRDDSGRITRMAGTVQDITEYKQLEQQFQEAQKLESVARLAGGVAHDFNNLLTVINGYSEMALLQMEDDGAAHDSIIEVRKAGERAASLTHQLLAFSRRQVLQPKVLDLNAVIADMEKMLHRLIDENIHLETKLNRLSGYIVADAGQMQQIVMNLVVNARDAMPNGGVLAIETRELELDQESINQWQDFKPGGYVALTVSDTGIGMDEATKSRLFEPFFTTKPRGSGTGLGLSTVYGIVKQSGGAISVASERNKGTTFTILLPRFSGREPGIGEPAAKTNELRGTETILVVEDQPEVRKFITEALRRQGYCVMEAGSGDEALKVWRSGGERIQLVLTDVVMPGVLNGHELAAEFARLEPKTRLLLMSGYTDEAIIEQGVQAGAAFLQKPFTPEALAMKVRQVLEGREEGAKQDANHSKRA